MPRSLRKRLDDDFLSLLSDEPDEVTDADIHAFIQRELVIVDKDNASRIIPFRLNELQTNYWKGHTDYDYILKSRKGGFSTLIMAEGFARACLIPNQQIVFLAHRKESADLIFQGMHRFYNSLSPEMKDKVNGGKTIKSQSKSRIEFSGNGSQILSMAASAPDALRGMTPTFVHLSEFAFYREEWAADSISATLASIPPGGMARMETTPSTVASYAYEIWHSAIMNDSRFRPWFFPWWDDPTNIERNVKWDDLNGLSEEEMTLMKAHGLQAGHIAWRRLKIKEQGIRKFRREYPEDSEQCWTRAGATVFDMELVAQAFGGTEPRGTDDIGLIVHEEPKDGHTYTIGADPAGGNENGDFSAAVCIDDTTGHEAFSFLARMAPHEFAAEIARLGLEYGEACLAVERNNHGHAVLQYLTIEDPYPYLFVEDDGKLGINTTQRSKANMISILDRFLADADLHLASRNLYRQMSSFVYDEHDRASGGGGAGVDDLVSALLCASFALNFNSPKGVAWGNGDEKPKAKAPPMPTSHPAPEEAMQHVANQLFMQSGLPFGQMLPVMQGDKPQAGCSECGSTRTRLVYGTWVCAGCGVEMPMTPLV